VTLESRSPLLLGRCSRQLRKSYAAANVVYSRTERVFIFEHHFVSKSFAAVREAFSNAYPDKEVPNKIAIHRLVKTFRDTGSSCLWQVLIERQKSWNYGRTDFKQCISCNDGMRLQEFNLFSSFCEQRGACIIIRFVFQMDTFCSLCVSPVITYKEMYAEWLTHSSNWRCNLFPPHISPLALGGISLNRIWGSHGGEYEDCCLLGCSTV
jgi:hypothetical protein